MSLSPITPVLDIFLPETHSTKLLAVGDVTHYPEGFTVITPTLEITPPGWNKVTFPYVAGSVQVYDSNTLEITAGCEPINLPDGIYTIKYSIAPSYKYYVEKQVFMVNNLLEKLDECWIKATINCELKRTDMTILDGIEAYINAAIAASNKCAVKMAQHHYNEASRLLDNYLNK